METFNQTLQNILVKFIEENKISWDEFLDTCTFAYNTAEHESTKFSPFQLMFGRKSLLPVDIQKSGSYATNDEFDVSDTQGWRKVVNSGRAKKPTRKIFHGEKLNPMDNS